MDKMRLIETVTDIAKLTPEEFERFLPDLLAWHHLAHIALNAGTGGLIFKWVDDGKMGELHHIKITTKETGEETVIKGSAYSV